MFWPLKTARARNNANGCVGRTLGPFEQPSPGGSSLSHHILCRCEQYVCKFGVYELHMCVLGARLVGLISDDSSEGNLMRMSHTPSPHHVIPSSHVTHPAHHRACVQSAQHWWKTNISPIHLCFSNATHYKISFYNAFFLFTIP